MYKNLARFMEILETENRAQALAYIRNILDKGHIPFYEVYESILGPALNNMQATGLEDRDIWNEHIRTAIIRMIVENTFPYVIRARDRVTRENGKTVVVFCPPEEYHTVGARMVTDVFIYLGFEAIFVGGNTPFRVVEAGLKSRKIDYLAISVSNPYHLISTRNMIEAIRERHPHVRIILGGHAVKRFGDRATKLKADYIMTTFKDLAGLVGGGNNETPL